MPAIPCRPSRAERIAVGAFFLLLTLVHLWGIRYRLDTLDEGYFIYTTSRVYAGELPYRDFSTPYTPAFFYLNALAYRLFGLEIVTLRATMLVARIGVYLLVYLLGRRIMPAPFALVPVLMLMAEDPAPGVWESHPAWWATLFMLLAVWSVCRHCERGGLGWWLGASISAGLSFAFKQNIGIFAAAALVTVALLDGRTLPSLRAPIVLSRVTAGVPAALAERLRRAGGPAALLALFLGTTWGMRAHLEPTFIALLSVPFAALAVERIRAARGEREDSRVALPGGRTAGTRARLALVMAGFAAVTLPWLAALTLALGPGRIPLNQFIGAIDTAGYYFGLEPPRPGFLPVLGLIALTPLALWLLFRPRPLLPRLGIAIGSLGLASALVAEVLRRAPEVHPRLLRAAALLSVEATDFVILYLPALAFWAGLGLLLAGRVPTPARFFLRWYLLAGSLLLLNQYPRYDDIHLPHSAPLLWVVGAYALWRLHRVLTRGLGSGALGGLQRAIMLLALLVLPLASVWPMLIARRPDFVIRQPGGLMRLTSPDYEWLELPGVNVYELSFFAEKYRRMRAYFEANTAPGERIFVYPAAPLLYYLVDRPNATRFNHVFPGLLSRADEQETIERLESVPAAYVIWDVLGSEFWTRPGHYADLERHIWERYEPVESSVGGYEILRRKAR